VRALLDTHALLWWLCDSPSLSQTARDAIAHPDHAIYVSSASVWEIATKHRLGKLPGVEPLLADISGALALSGFQELPIGSLHACAAGSMAHEHRDPFDRMIAAQGMIESLVVITADPMLAALGATVLW
jgi:PIN domain nuclease of toxin-antitoxin system